MFLVFPAGCELLVQVNAAESGYRIVGMSMC